MPIYAYRCETCGFQQDVLQKMSDARLTVCPSCGNPTFQKQVTAAGFQLKGSGWYVTDFRNPAAKAGTKTDSPEAKSEGTSDKSDAPAADKGSESAPAASPAPAASTETKSAPAPAAAKAPPASGST